MENATGRLKDKVAIITGAGQGIGRGIALAMAKEGAHIVVSGRSEEKCGPVVKEIEDLGRRALFARCDVTVKPEIEDTVRQTMEAFGSIDILVNNAHDTRS